MKAFTVANTARVYVYSDPVSMSRSFPGLSDLVSAKLKKKPESGDLYLFVNKKKTYLKVLFWAKDGFCIFAKKLPKGIFDSEGWGSTMKITELEEMVNRVVIHGAKKLSHLKVA